MTSPATALTRGQSRSRSVASSLAGIVGVAVLLALASQVAIPLPGTPVPITLQPLVVVLAGFWLGPVAGAASMALYLIAGALGAPVFAPIGAPGIARLLGPTGGYLLAYPLAAYAAGWLGARSTTYSARVLAAVAGILVLYLGGALQLLALTGSARSAISLGVMPFLILDVVKAHLAALAAPRQGRRAPA
jgi:biotin transport system substrate-specific component